MLRYLSACTFLLCFIESLWAQNLLAVENPYSMKRELYHQGDILKFKTQDNKRWFEGVVEEVYDSSVVIVKELVYFDGPSQRKDLVRNKIPFSEIRMVSYQGRSKVNGFQKVFGVSSLLAGGYLVTVTLINVLTTPSDQREVDEGSFYIAGGFAAAGIILLATAKNKHRVGEGKRWRIRMMPPMSPELVPTGPK